MSAITGIFFRDGRKVDSKLMKKMNESLSHRGPDGSHIWIDGSVGFGHQMLWTTHESLHEKLPFEDEESGLVITADARIDNRDELSKELCIEDKIDISDSCFILKAYEKWGEKCPEYLLGDFAFVIWDKNEEKLFCARDHMGVKPFYYYLSDEEFYFSTEIKAILSIPGVQCELNEERIADYLGWLFENREITFYKNISRLPAANKFFINFKKNIKGTYWSLDPSFKLNLDSNEEYTKYFHNIFFKAVKCRLRSAFPIGSELSGGLDSSSVVCVAQNILSKQGNNLSTFSIIFDNFPDCDESYYINKVLDKYRVKPYYVYGNRVSPLDNINNILWYGEEPPQIANMSLFWNIYQNAQKQHIRVLLNGVEGDATLGIGIGGLSEIFYKGEFRSFLKEIKGVSRRINESPYKIFMEDIIFASLPKQLKAVWHRFNEVRFTHLAIKPIKEDFSQKIKLKKRLQAHDRYGNSIRDSRKNHYNELNSGKYQLALEYQDKTSAAFAIERRYPFMDRRLLEFCLAIPIEQKMHNGWDRIIMRRAMDDILPKEIQWRRSKKFFDTNFNNTLYNYNIKHLESLVLKNHVGKYIDINELKNIYSKFKSNMPSSGFIGHESRVIWEIACLDAYLNQLSNFENKL